MAFGRLILLSNEEVERVHETSLKILRRIGIKVLSRKVQSLLAENGAEVDAARSIVKIQALLSKRRLRKRQRK